MKKKLTRLFSVLLAAVLVFGTLPVSAMGTDVADPPASAVDDTSVDVSAAEPEEEESSAVDETPDGEEVETQSADLEAATVEPVAAPSLDEEKPYNIFFLDCGRKYYSVESIEKLIDNASTAGFNYIQLAVGNDGLRFLLDDMSLTVNGTTYESAEVSSAIHAGNEAYYNFDTDELTQSEMDTIIAYANSKGMGVIPCVNTPGHMDAILSAANSLTGETCSYNSSVRTIDVTNSTAVAFTQALLQKYISYFAGKGCEFFNMGADEYANDKYTTGSMGFGNLQSEGNYSYYITYVNTVAAMIKTAGMTPMAFNDGIYFKNNTSSGTIDTDIVVCYWSAGWGTGADSYTPMPASDLAAKGFRLINTHGDYYWVLGKTNAQCSAEKASGFDPKTFQGSTIDNPLGSMFCIWADYPGAETEANVISKTADTIAAFGAKLPKDEIVISDAANDTADGGELTVGTYTVLVANKKVDWTTSNSSVASIASADNDAASAYSADTVNAKAITVTAGKAGSATITATADNKTATYTVTVNDPGSKTITVNVNGTETETVDGNYPGPFTTGNTGIATVQTEVEKIDGKPTYESASLALGTFYVSASANDTAPSATLTFEDAGNGEYYIKDSNDNYIYPNATRSGKNWTVSKGTGKQAVNVDKNESYVTIYKTYSSGYSSVKACLKLENGDFTASKASNNAPKLYLYTAKTPDPTYKTKITFTGVSVGETTVKIGDVTYKIVVEAEDLTKVTPLEIQYWITNSRLTGTTTNKDAYTINASDANTEEGLTVAGLVDQYGAKDGRNQEYWKAVMLDTQLENSSTSGTELQTTKEGDDETLNGTAFTKVRYWEGKWQVYTTTWVDVNRTQVSVGYTGDNNQSKTYTGDKNQLVAYYMEVVDIANAENESELHVNAADWGTKGDGTGSWGYTPESNRCSVSVQLVYEDSTKNPADTTADALKSKTIVYGYWSGGRGLGTMLFTGMNNYEIYKITAETGNMTSTASDSNTVTVTNFTWDKNEEVVWGGDDQEPVASASIGNPARTPSYTEPYDNLAWNTSDYNKNNAILIRVYVKAHENPDSLRVHYIDATNGKSEEFYSYNINVKQGTTFDEGFALENGVLTNNTVKNNVGVTQTVESDLKKMTSIGAQYRYSNFTCVKAERSGDGKDVYLYYTFNDTVNFIVDFGTPLKIEPKDINAALVGTGVELTSVEVKGAKHGTVEKNGTTFTYTPDSRFASSEDGETLTVTYTGKLATEENKIQEGSKAYQVYIYPASNVLYEENFLSTEEARWSKEYFTEHTDAQETQKAGDTGTTYNVFGYDPNASATGANGYWQMKDLDQKNVLGEPLTTTFYGNAFDLIGDCGEDTGRVLIAIVNKDDLTQRVKMIDVDTRYNAGTLHQVPLAHAVMTSDAHYQVEIYATKLPESTTTVNTPRGVASYAYDASAEEDEFLDQVLDAYGLTMDDVDYISTATADTLDADSNGVAVYSSTRTATSTITHKEGTHVEIDGFRVYRSTAGDVVADSYPSSEKGATYQNILDVVKDELVKAYIEGGVVESIEVENYQDAGGPQNEIYLPEGSSVVFSVAKVDEVQVSLRAVDGATQWNNNDISSNTEMYYKVEKKNGTFTILNTGSELLAIGNVKIPAGAGETKTASEIGEDVLLKNIQAIYSAGSEEPEVFVPKTFTAKTTSTPVIRNKVVTLKVNVSSDVAYITVNGVKYTRTGLQGLFQATRTIRVVNTVPKNQTKTYEIVAYDADGVASETITVTG